MIEQLLIATIAGLFGLVPALIQWLVRRSQARSRDARVQRLKAELELLEKCLLLSRETSDAGLKVLSEQSLQEGIERVVAEYREWGHPRAPAEPEKPGRILWLRRWFLLYRPRSLAGWIIHSLYYFLWLFVLTMVAFSVGAEDLHLPTLVLGLLMIFGPMILALQLLGLRRRKADLKHE